MKLFTQKTLIALVAAGVAITQAPRAAHANFDQYCTFISDSDKFASDGFALSDAASILRQDRANFHKFNRRDTGDRPDRSFRSPNARARIPALLANGGNDRRLLNAIVNQNIYVCVEVWSDFMVVYQE